MVSFKPSVLREIHAAADNKEDLAYVIDSGNEAEWGDDTAYVID